MKPASFDYVAPKSIEEALDLLSSREDAKILAGGQSLVPLLSLRLARPTVLVDVNGLAGLADIIRENGRLRLGALCRHRRLETDPTVSAATPLLAEAIRYVASPAIRNRGTLGGSLSHGDPVSELPAVLLALAGSVTVRRKEQSRTIAAGDLYNGFLTTSIAEDEMLTEVTVPAAEPGEGSAFVEFAPRRGDFAVAGLAVTVTRDTSGCTSARSAGAGLGSTPVDLGQALSDLLGERELGDRLLRSVAEQLANAVDPPSDIHGSAEYRRELAQVLMVQAVRLAWDRAGRTNEGVER